MTSPTHDELRELTGAYVLGMLSQAERERFEVHLATCADCAREVEELGLVAAALPHAVPQQDPPRALRARVLQHAVAEPQLQSMQPIRPKRRNMVTWLAAAASIAAVALGLYNMTLRQRIRDLEGRLRDASAQLAASQGNLQIATAALTRANQFAAVLQAPDVRQIPLAGQKAAPTAAGRAFWSPSRGLVFTASNLPPVSPGRQYQLWVIPPGGSTPISAGLLDLESGGIATVLVDPKTAASVGTVAVTVEPAGGVPQPTGDMVLAGTL